MELQELVEIEQIKRLKYRYLRCLDQKDWDDLEQCFTEDATASYGGGAYPFEGRDRIMAFLREAMGADTFHSSHQCHHPEIDVTGDGTATGVWALQDVVIDTGFDLTISGAAFYTDRYRRIDGDWRIEHTGYKRLYEEVFPRGDVTGLRLTASWWTTDGRSELAG